MRLIMQSGDILPPHMEFPAALKSQYHAALKTLRLAVERCPDALWLDRDGACAPFWRVAYHTLFYTHFYLQKDHESFRPWAKHRADAQFLDETLPWENNRPVAACVPYTKQELLDYCQACNDMIDSAVDAMDLSAPECGFPWYPMPKIEHQLVNLRHIQHHAGILSSRLCRSAGVNIDWMGRA
jgi:hypothetical protein